MIKGNQILNKRIIKITMEKKISKRKMIGVIINNMERTTSKLFIKREMRKN